MRKIADISNIAIPAATGLAGLGLGGLVGHQIGRSQKQQPAGLAALPQKSQDNIAKIMVGLGVHNPDDLKRLSDMEILALTSGYDLPRSQNKVIDLHASHNSRKGPAMRKAAKVYDASESVEGTKPKVVYESHKKCTPGEFGVQVKQAERYGPKSIAQGNKQLGTPALNQMARQGRNVFDEVAQDEQFAKTHPIAAQSYNAADQNFNKARAAGWNLPARLGHNLSGAYNNYMGGMQANGETLGNAYGAARNFLVNNSRGPSRLQAMPPVAHNIAGSNAAGMTKTQSAFEFGMRVKEANTLEALKALLGMSATGAGVGALVGAARAPKGKRLRTMLGDAAVGGTVGLGFGAGSAAGGLAGGPNSTMQDSFPSGLGAGLGAVGAGALAHKIRNEMEEDYDNNNSPLLNAIAKQATASVGGSAAAGAGIGALIGALRAPKGKMLKYTLGGAGIGGLSGAGGAAGYNLIGHAGSTPEEKMLRLPLAIGGSALAGHLGNKLYDEVEHHIPEKKDKKEKKTEKKSASPIAKQGAGLGGVGGGLGGYYFGASPGSTKPVVARDGQVAKAVFDPETGNRIGVETVDKSEPMVKTQSAREFGQKVAFNIDWNALKHPALGGAALGALAGGVHGLIAPGEDERGNPRSRFGAMLRGALGGGAIGGLGGAAAGHFAPKATNDLINNLRYQYTMHTPVPTQAQTQARQNFTSAGEEPFMEGDVMNPAMQAAQG